MTIEQQVFEKLRDLPPEKKKGALDFVDFLKEKTGQRSLGVVCVACGRILKFKSRKKILLRLAAKYGAVALGARKEKWKLP